MSEGFKIGPNTLAIYQGDLTQAEVEVIVNAANPSLAGGGGVDGAIHRAAGPGLLKAGQDYVQQNGPLTPGQAVITPGFELWADFVIHTVGPIWTGGQDKEAEILEQAYANCLHLAAAKGLRRIAFPAVSCGVYGFPEDRASTLALSTAIRSLSQDEVSEASWYLFSKTSYLIWRDTARRLSAGKDKE